MKTTRLSDTSTAKPKSAERSHCNNGRRVALLPFLKCLGQSKNSRRASQVFALGAGVDGAVGVGVHIGQRCRSEEHTSELQSLMRISYAVFFLKKKKTEQY